MNLYVVRLVNGNIGIVAAKDLASAWKDAQWSTGADNVADVRAATQDDVDWVRSMGGRVPKGRIMKGGEE